MLTRLRSLYGRSLYGALLLVVFVGLAAPAIVGSYLVIGVQERAAVGTALVEALRRNADILALGVQEPVWNLNPEAARPLLNAMLRDPSIARVEVRGADGAPGARCHAPARV